MSLGRSVPRKTLVTLHLLAFLAAHHIFFTICDVCRVVGGLPLCSALPLTAEGQQSTPSQTGERPGLPHKRPLPWAQGLRVWPCGPLGPAPARLARQRSQAPHQCASFKLG